MQKFYQKHVMDDVYIVASEMEENGSVSCDADVSTSLKLGEKEGETFKTVLSFATGIMADTTVTGASIFLHRDSVFNASPVGTTLTATIKNGAMGVSLTVEITDYINTGDAEATACIFGENDQNGDWLRIDLPETFFEYIKNDNKTQFLLSAEGASEELIYFSGTDDSEFAPILNVQYKSVFASLTADKAKEKVTVFPNPATNQLTILTPQQEIEEITITGLNGQRVMLNTAPTSNIIDIQMLPKGHYFIKIVTKNEIFISKFIKI